MPATACFISRPLRKISEATPASSEIDFADVRRQRVNGGQFPDPGTLAGELELREKGFVLRRSIRQRDLQRTGDAPFTPLGRGEHRLPGDDDCSPASGGALPGETEPGADP